VVGEVHGLIDANYYFVKITLTEYRYGTLYRQYKYYFVYRSKTSQSFDDNADSGRRRGITLEQQNIVNTE